MCFVGVKSLLPPTVKGFPKLGDVNINLFPKSVKIFLLFWCGYFIILYLGPSQKKNPR